MNLIEFTGMRRSGNHAIIFWMLQNLSNLDNFKVKQYVDESSYINHCEIISTDEFLYFNNVNLRRCDDVHKTLSRERRKWIIISYEDCHVNYGITLPYEFENRYKFSIVRDVRNLVASRLKRLEINKNNENHIIPNSYMIIFKGFFQYYISHKNWKTPIFYDKWLVDKNYRDSICDIVKVPNVDKTNYVSPFGNGSSFVGVQLDKPENLLNRKDSFKIPEPILKRIEELNL